MVFDYRPITLDVDSGDRTGMLVLRGDALLAIVAQLSEQHDDQAGWWFVEFVLNPRLDLPRRPFPTLEALDRWMSERLR